jgi:hypothetical protein
MDVLKVKDKLRVEIENDSQADPRTIVKKVQLGLSSEVINCIS